jgi:hypothetical protein
MKKAVYLTYYVLIFIPFGLLAQSEQVIFLTGQAVLADGNPAPQSLVVEMVCEGKIVRQTHPAKNGSFSFDLGNKDQPTFDTRQTGPAVAGTETSWDRSTSLSEGFRRTPDGRIDLTACVVRLAPTVGYSANEISLSQRRTMDKPDIGVLVIGQGEPTEPASDKVLVSTLQAPPKAMKAFQKAREELSKEKVDYKNAAKELEKAVKEYPQFTAALTLLGETYESLNESQKAFEAFTKAVETGEDYLPAYLNLARAQLETGQFKDAEKMSVKALEIDPSVPHGLFYKGISSYYLKDMQASEDALGKLKESGQSQEFPVALLHLGMIHAQQGKIPEAAVELRDYLAYSPETMVPPERKKKIEAQLENWRQRGLIE